MARNPTVNKTQEAVIRDFVFEAEAVGLELGGDIWAAVYAWLDYKRLPSGVLVSTDTQVRVRFGGNFDAYPDQYGPDGEEFNGDNSTDTVNTSSSGASTGDSVGSVLRKEV